MKSVLLYGSETWNLTKSAMARLEGFHIQAGYQMAEEHKPRRGSNQAWKPPRSKDVINECGMGTIAHYIGVRRKTIPEYVVNRLIYEMCRAGVRGRGLALRQWWWEQPMSLNKDNARVGELM